MKKLRYAGFLLIAIVLLFGIFLIYSTLTWYDPPQELILSESSNPDTIPCDSTFSVLSWNIGYAGLGDDMDFFYDGGQKVRDTREQTLENLDSIHQFLKRNSTQTFILIQEVDLHSKRSYFINEMDSFVNQTIFHSAFATNYKVGFVPVPPSSPMGQVNSGVMSLSRYLPESSTRYGFPGMFTWPNRLFNLRRCMLVNRYPTSNGKEFILINTHLSAFDDGSLKKQEMDYLRSFVLSEYASGNYVVAGGDWNQTPPDFPLTQFGAESKNESFLLTNIASDFMPKGWKWIFDPEVPTNRYNNETYIPGKTFRCLIDQFLISPNIEVLYNKTFDLNFRNSDHNPIFLSFKLSGM